MSRTKTVSPIARELLDMKSVQQSYESLVKNPLNEPGDEYPNNQKHFKMIRTSNGASAAEYMNHKNKSALLRSIEEIEI